MKQMRRPCRNGCQHGDRPQLIEQGRATRPAGYLIEGHSPMDIKGLKGKVKDLEWKKLLLEKGRQ
jgi:hypothetical protein